MILPLGTDRPLKRPTVVTHGLIVLNALAFLGQIIAARGAGGMEGVFERFALHPEGLTWWSFITYQFLHGDALHIAGNMLFLWCFGPNVEDRIGRVWFLLFYLVGGCAAGGLHSLFESSPVIGASGSISAVTGAYLVLFPRTQVKVFLFFFLIGIFQIPAVWFLGASIAWDVIFNSGRDSGVAIGAHIGGYIFGAGVSFGLLASGLLKREPYDMFSIAKQAHRRRVFKGEVAKGRGAWSGEHGMGVKEGKRAEADAASVERRGAVHRALESKDVGAMASAYRALLAHEPDGTVSREAQLELANRLYAGEEKDLAACAYEGFLKRHPKDVEAPLVRLMLALICARHQNDPVRAKALAQEAMSGRLTADQRALGEALLAELG
ncbi:MAG: rhomboid family intramembrane serine protease [Phycisphaerales bacterium]